MSMKAALIGLILMPVILAGADLVAAQEKQEKSDVKAWVGKNGELKIGDKSYRHQMEDKTKELEIKLTWDESPHGNPYRKIEKSMDKLRDQIKR